MTAPESMKERLRLLHEICEKYPIYIPTDVCADYMGMDVNCLRESINQGKCKFAVGGQNGARGNRFAKIPTLAFYNFITQGCAL